MTADERERLDLVIAIIESTQEITAGVDIVLEEVGTGARPDPQRLAQLREAVMTYSNELAGTHMRLRDIRRQCS